LQILVQQMRNYDEILEMAISKFPRCPMRLGHFIVILALKDWMRVGRK
jgi:hypothetical protein